MQSRGETDVWYDDISDTSSVSDDYDILEPHVESVSSTGTISLISSSPKPYSVERPPDVSTGKMEIQFNQQNYIFLQNGLVLED